MDRISVWIPLTKRKSIIRKQPFLSNDIWRQHRLVASEIQTREAKLGSTDSQLRAVPLPCSFSSIFHPKFSPLAYLQAFAPLWLIIRHYPLIGARSYQKGARRSQRVDWRKTVKIGWRIQESSIDQRKGDHSYERGIGKARKEDEAGHRCTQEVESWEWSCI